MVDKMIDIITVNELLQSLGHKNILLTKKPLLHWDGNNITDDETAPVKYVSSYMLNENFNLFDFLKRYEDKKIVIMVKPGTRFIGKIRAFIS